MVVFDDPTATVIKHLNESLSGVEAHGRVPLPRPPQLVRCLHTGSDNLTAMHRRARVTVECWAETDTDANQLAGRVERAVLALQTPWNRVPFGVEAFAGGAHESPDPDTGTPRVVFTINLHQRRH